MKKVLLFSAILLGSAGLVSAQNARKTKTAKTAKTAKTVTKTEAERKAHNADIISRKKADQASKTTIIATKAN